MADPADALCALAPEGCYFPIDAGPALVLPPENQHAAGLILIAIAVVVLVLFLNNLGD